MKGAAPPEVPPWVGPLDELLREAIRRAPLLAHATPLNLDAELVRLESAWLRGKPLDPRFTYRRPPEGAVDLAAVLLAAVRSLPEGDPLTGVYARRALQVCGDLHWVRDLASGLASAVGAHRFPRRDEFDDQADDLAHRWTEEVAASTVAPERSGGPYRALPSEGDDGPDPDLDPARAAGDALERQLELQRGGDIVTDDERDPRSMVCRLRAVIGERRLPARVVVVAGIAPLAATGDGVVQVAAGRRVTVADVERTVVHEVDGHLVPACEAKTRPLGIFSIGTAHGSDDQEGRALLFEVRGGHLGTGGTAAAAWRCRQLGLRHVAARAAQAGASLEEIVEAVVARGGLPRESVRVAARAFRGGGLAREAVYIAALLRVQSAIAADPAIECVLAAGRVGVDDAAVLAPWARGDA